MPTTSAPTASSSTSSLATKPTHRGSLRHSLGLASMGKALVDVMNSGSSKESKSGSRKLGARPSTGDASLQQNAPPRKGSPEPKTISRKRVSVQLDRPSVDVPSKEPVPAISASNPVSAGLRPRTSGGTTAGMSALPKYRPKSQLGSKKAPPSPTRQASRRRFDSSDEDSSEQKHAVTTEDGDSISAYQNKAPRPISPLPKTLKKVEKVNLTGAISVSPTPPKKRAESPVSKKTEQKHSKSLSAAISRPASAASTTSQVAHTPRGGLRAALGLKSSKTPEPSPNPFRSVRERAESPLAKHSRKVSRDIPNFTPKQPTKSATHPTLVLHTPGGSSDTDDSDEDVAQMLAPVASPSAPTPTIPRVRATKSRKHEQPPSTPTRKLLPTRENLSYLSPLPADSPSKPRPKLSNADQAARGSLFSWEHMVENSITLEADELGKMLKETDAPFRPGALSPTPSIGLEIPDSPCLSAMPSPGGYGAISHVLLPDVTPSPAVHAGTSQRFDDAFLGPSVNDVNNTVYQLRLQLEAARSTARERLDMVMRLEQELQAAKTTRAKEAEDLARQVSILEAQMMDGIEAQQRAKETHAAAIQNHLRDREQAAREAAKQAAAISEQEFNTKLGYLRRKQDIQCAARSAASEWRSVTSLAVAELDLVKGNHDMLALLQLELDRLEATLTYAQRH